MMTTMGWIPPYDLDLDSDHELIHRGGGGGHMKCAVETGPKIKGRGRNFWRILEARGPGFTHQESVITVL